MSKCLLVNRWSVATVLGDENVTKRQYQSLDLSTSDWMLLEELVKALHTLEIATVFISSESMCSLSSVLPVPWVSWSV